MAGGGGPRPSAGRRKGTKDSRPRVRRTNAQFSSDELDIDNGSVCGIDILRLIYTGQPVTGAREEPPYPVDLMARCAAQASPFERPRLSAVSVDNKEGQDHVAFVRHLGEATKEANAREEAIRRETGEQLEGVLVKLSEDDAAVVRKATGLLPVNVHAQACLPKP